MRFVGGGGIKAVSEGRFVSAEEGEDEAMLRREEDNVARVGEGLGGEGLMFMS